MSWIRNSLTWIKKQLHRKTPIQMIPKPLTIQAALEIMKNFSPGAKDIIAQQLMSQASAERSLRLPIGFKPPLRSKPLRLEGGRGTLNRIK